MTKLKDYSKKIEWIKITVKYRDIEIADESTYFNTYVNKVWRRIKDIFLK